MYSVKDLTNIWHYFKLHYLAIPRFFGAVIVTIDGFQHHGGLADRFKLILSMYDYCKQRKIPFRLYYKYPCDISFFLKPNRYDWTVSRLKISYSKIDSKDVNLYVDSSHFTIDEIFAKHLQILNKMLCENKFFQYHVYGNTFFSQARFQALFEELFIPSEILTNRIKAVSKEWDEQYEAVVLRFQRLMGDFNEGKYKVLSSEDRLILMNKCVCKIVDLYNSHFFSTEKILVTSDSSVFLDEMKKFNFVYTIPGKLNHMDFVKKKDVSVENQIKPFLDLFLLKKSKKITLLRTGDMYDSGFPVFASNIGGIPFEKIEF